MTWETLRSLRASGKKPSLPVIVTTKKQLPQRLEGVGCLTIYHAPGEVMPVKLLDGLDVIFMFDRCELASKVWQLARRQNVEFKAQTWCTCALTLNVMPYACDSYAAMVDWAESAHVPA